MYESMINVLEQKLNKYERNNLESIDRSTVDDISNIKIDSNKSSVERILDFLLSYENPYIFKMENKLIKVQFSNNNVFAENCMTNIYINIYK